MSHEIRGKYCLNTLYSTPYNSLYLPICDPPPQSADTKQSIPLPVQAFAIEPNLCIAATSFEFGECPVDERTDVVVQLLNKVWACGERARAVSGRLRLDGVCMSLGLD